MAEYKITLKTIKYYYDNLYLIASLLIFSMVISFVFMFMNWEQNEKINIPENTYVDEAHEVNIAKLSQIDSFTNYYTLYEYKINEGDSLSEIAERFNLQLTDLMSYNNIKNPNLIYIGDVIAIPTANDKSQVNTASLGEENSTLDYYLAYDLRTASNANIDAIENYLEGTRLEGLGYAFVKAEKNYNMNAIYIMALAIHESNWGKSEIAKEKNNLFGFRAYDANPLDNASTYESFGASIDYAANFISEHYLDENGKYYNGANLIGMNKYYASSKQWSEQIAVIVMDFNKTSFSQVSAE